MTRMTSRVLDDSGNGVPGVYVYAELQGSAWLAGHAGQVETEVRGYTDRTGRWVLDLTPAGALDDTGAWWKIRTYQRGTVGVDVPPAPPGNTPVDVAGCLRPLGPPPEHAESYVPASRLGVAGGVATLGGDGLLTLGQRPPIDAGAVAVVAGDLIAEHAQAAEPHTAYDDLPPLSLLFENGLF